MKVEVLIAEPGEGACTGDRNARRAGERAHRLPALFEVRAGGGDLDHGSAAIPAAGELSGGTRSAFCIVAQENKVAVLFSALPEGLQESRESTRYYQNQVRRARSGDP